VDYNNWGICAIKLNYHLQHIIVTLNSGIALVFYLLQEELYLYETTILYLENINQYGIKDNAVQRIKYSKVSGQIVIDLSLLIF